MSVFFLFLLLNEPCPIQLVLKNGQTLCLQKPFSVSNRHILFNDQGGRFLQISRAKVDLQRSGAHHPTPASAHEPSEKQQRQFPWHLPAYRYLDATHVQTKNIVVETDAVERFGRQHPLPKPLTKKRSAKEPQREKAVSAMSTDLPSAWGRPRKRVVKSGKSNNPSSEINQSNPKKRAASQSKVRRRPNGYRKKR